MLARKRLRSRQTLKRVVVIFVVLAFLGGFAYAVWFSDIFTIVAIEVEGAVLVDESVISGPVEGNIIFWKSPVSEDEFPQLASIEVKKDFINRSIKIAVTERGKVIIWCNETNERCFWADDSGFIFTTSPIPEGVLVVDVVKDYTNRGLSIGDSVLPEELFVNLKYALELFDSLNISVKEVRIDDLRFKEATAVISGGPEVYISLVLDSRFGKGVLESLMDSQDWGLIRYVDLRVENRAYYSL